MTAADDILATIDCYGLTVTPATDGWVVGHFDWERGDWTTSWTGRTLGEALTALRAAYFVDRGSSPTLPH